MLSGKILLIVLGGLLLVATWSGEIDDGPFVYFSGDGAINRNGTAEEIMTHHIMGWDQ